MFANTHREAGLACAIAGSGSTSAQMRQRFTRGEPIREKILQEAGRKAQWRKNRIG
jgi:hypothetical protein